MDNKKVLAGVLFTASALFAYKAAKGIKELRKAEEELTDLDEEVLDDELPFEEKN